MCLHEKKITDVFTRYLHYAFFRAFSELKHLILSQQRNGLSLLLTVVPGIYKTPGLIIFQAQKRATSRKPKPKP